MKKILVPIDGSEYSKRAMVMAKELAEKFGSSIVLLNVIDFHFAAYPYDAKQFTENVMSTAKAHSDELLAEAKKNFDVMADKVDVLRLEGNPANEIIDFVNSSDVDLVVMGSHGMNVMQRFFIGSVTNRVLNHIKVPIFIVK